LEGKSLKKTIYDRIGGKDVIYKVVDTHYDRALENEKLGGYF
jgi:truncated hemoglobin YjbI